MPTLAMAVSYTDIPGSGEFDLHDRFEVNLHRVGARVLGSSWRHNDLAAPHWRLYCNKQDGSVIHPKHQRSIPLIARERYLIPPWIHYAGSDSPQVEHIFCHFDILGFPGSLIRDLFPNPIRLPTRTQYSDELIAWGDRLAMQTQADLEIVCGFKAAIFNGVGEIVAGLRESDKHRLFTHIRRDLPVRDAVEWIERHLDRELSNAVLATHLRISSDHCIRLFRRWLGQTPSSYVQERRVAAAARALAYTEDSIEDISAAFGFANRHYFSRVFRTRMGMPPAAYREAHIRPTTTM